MLSLVVFLIIISTLVLIHELGHFLAARKFGIRVEEFALGLPFTKSLWTKKKYGMDVSIYPILFGGFVKLTGEESIEKNADPKSFANKAVWQRVIVVVAGVGMNLLLGVFLYTIVLGARSWQSEVVLPLPYQFVGATVTKQTSILVGNVASGSPAQASGITPGALIQFLDDQPVSSVESLQKYIKEHTGKPVKVTWSDLRSKTSKTVIVIPRAETPTGEGRIGVGIEELTKATLDYGGFPRVIFSGLLHSYNMAAYSLKVTAQIFYRSIATRDIRPLSHSVAGPVGVERFVNDIIKSGDQAVVNLLELTALLSLSLGMLNILPIPALDGGRLIFLFLEALAGRRLIPKVELRVQQAGMALLFMLIVIITYNDIIQALGSTSIGNTLRRFLPQ